MKLSFVLAVALIWVSGSKTFAQYFIGDAGGDIKTAMSFLRIQASATGAGAGNLIVSNEPAASAILGNPAKTVFIEKRIAAEVNLVPELFSLAGLVYLAQLGVCYQLNDRHAIGASFRYFDRPEWFLSIAEVGNLYELSLDFSYAYQINKELGVGLTSRYVKSRIGAYKGSLIVESDAAIFAADLGLFYRKQLPIGEKKCVLAAGFVLSNIGGKPNYSVASTSTSTRTSPLPLPSGIAIGSSYSIYFNSEHQLVGGFEASKLLVMTLDLTDSDNNGFFDYQERSTLSGMLNSFVDADGGFKEEASEIFYSVGLEYKCHNRFSAGIGSVLEHKEKGDRKHLTLGIGLRIGPANASLAYFAPLTDKADRALFRYRIGLGFELGAVSWNERGEGP